MWTTATSTVALIGAIWGGMVTMDSRYAPMSELKALNITVLYGEFYDLLDKVEHAEEDGKPDLARELKRRLEKVKAQICAEEPTWERCNN